MKICVYRHAARSHRTWQRSPILLLLPPEKLGITQICIVCILKIHAPPCDIVTDKLLLWLQAEHQIQYQTQHTRLPYRAHAQKHLCLPPLRITATHSSNGLVVSRNVCRFSFPQDTGQPSRAHGFTQDWLLYLKEGRGLQGHRHVTESGGPSMQG